MELTIGSPAPAFSMVSSEKEIVSNETLKGKKALLLFFPAAFTGVCTKEMCSMRDDLATYNNLNANVVGISTDSIFTLAKFKELEKLNFTLASDYNKEVSAAFGTAYADWVHGMKGTSKRSAFVLDENGIVEYAEVLESAGDLPNFDAIKSALAS
nr:peroxiredoxin [Bacteroidota bacterium]